MWEEEGSVAAEDAQEQQTLCFDRKKRKKYSSLLEEWYGSDAPGAVAKHLPKPENLSDVLAGLTKKLVSSHCRYLNLPLYPIYQTPLQ